MPRRDGTGPQGMGPMTGRKAGNCNRKSRRQFTENDELPANNNTEGILGFFKRNFRKNSNRPGQGRGKRG